MRGTERGRENTQEKVLDPVEKRNVTETSCVTTMSPSGPYPRQSRDSKVQRECTCRGVSMFRLERSYDLETGSRRVHGVGILDRVHTN